MPFKNLTKGELVKTLVDDGLEEIARNSISCIHHSLREQVARQCGVCPACLGRRQAMTVAGIEEDSREYKYDIFASIGGTRVPPPEALDYLAATLGQVADFKAINSGSDLPESLANWLLGSSIVTHMAEAGPWLSILRRYRNEWLGIARKSRDRGLAWPRWLEVADNENEKYAYDSS